MGEGRGKDSHLVDVGNPQNGFQIKLVLRPNFEMNSSKHMSERVLLRLIRQNE
jgi:hypothetical protein